MTGGCWLLLDGKKVAAVRQPDGTAKPLKKQPAPTPTAAEED